MHGWRSENNMRVQCANVCIYIEFVTLTRLIEFVIYRYICKCVYMYVNDEAYDMRV